MILKLSRIGLLVLLVGFYGYATAQTAQPPKRPKIGLALSGGASKGMSHIGVLQVLEENGIPIDYIAGTSMGAIIGGLYVSGYSVDTLEKIVRQIPWNDMYFGQIQRNQKFVDQRVNDEKYVLSLPIIENQIGLPDGLINNQRFYNELVYYTTPVHAITDFDSLPIPFRAIAADLKKGNAYVFDSGSLALAILASMSIPSILKPVKIGDQVLVDGGIIRNLPAEDARKMGADIVIAVDVSSPSLLPEEIETMFDVLDQTLNIQSQKQLQEQYELSDIIIRPEVGRFSATDFDSLDQYIRLGREATEYVLDEIIEVVGKEHLFSKPLVKNPIPNPQKSFLLNDIFVIGVPTAQLLFVKQLLNCKPNELTTLETIHVDRDRLLGLGLFENISYRLIPTHQKDNTYDLYFTMETVKTERFNLGIRYDNHYKASILLNAFLRDRLGTTSELSGTLRIGDEYFAELYYRKLRLIPPRLSLNFRISFSRLPLEVYSNYLRTAELGLNRLNAALELTSTQYIHVSNLLRFKTEYFYTIENFGLNPASNEDYINSVYYSITFDNKPTNYYSHSGTLARLSIENANQYLASPIRYTQIRAKFDHTIPLTSFFTWELSGFSGTTFGKDLPYYLSYFAGGGFPSLLLGEQEQAFWGFKNRQISAPQFHTLGTQFNWEIFTKRFISLVANYGITNTDFSFVLDDNTRIWGYGIVVGALTPLGPVQVGLSTGSFENIVAGLNFGFRF